MKKAKIIAIVLCVALFATIFSGCAKKEEDTIKIGMIGPLTGEVAMYGTAVLNAVNLYVEQYNAAGGLDGKMIEIISYDDKHDATEATNAYNKLATSDEVVAIIGAVTSTPTIAVAQASLADKMPLMTPTATHPDVTSFGNNMFRSCFLDPFQGSTMAKFAKNELGAMTAAVIYHNSDAYSTGLYESFIATADEIGLEIVASESYAGTDTDFKSQLSNIAAKSPDVIFAPDYYNNLYLIMSQGKDVGVTAKYLGVDGADGILGIDGVDKTLVEGLYFANHYSTQDQSKIVQDFLTGYKAKYNEDPSALAALGYDAAMLMIAAIEKVAATTEIEPTAEVFEKIIAELDATDMDAVTGHITYDDNNNPQKTVAIILVKDGE
ncbi:MAG: ABC transporter substrate-binding protein, partial [Saccharofermentanales bacterium]